MLAPPRRVNSAASMAMPYKVFNNKNSMVGEIPRATLASCAAGADILVRPLGLLAVELCQEVAHYDGSVRASLIHINVDAFTPVRIAV